MNIKTNLAIIGYGFMGHIYKKACLELYEQKNIETYYKYNLPVMLKEFTLKAIVDTGFENSCFNEEEGIWYFSSIDIMLQHNELEIDTAVIATPIKTHLTLADKLIRSKLSLLIEKPVCETAKDVKKLIQLSKKNRVKIMPGHIERYNPVTLDASEAVKYKIYGKIEKYCLLRESPKPERVQDNLITDKLIHDLDLVHCILGKFKIEDIQIKRIDGIIMECILSTIHKRGVKGTIISSWLSVEKNRTITIDFERGSLAGDLINKKTDIDRYMELSKQISAYKNNQIKDQLVDFIAYTKKIGKTLVTIDDALNSAFLIDEINRKVKDEI
jgi:UDP-N-acetylglucosamine 3-dehydrogenase